MTAHKFPKNKKRESHWLTEMHPIVYSKERKTDRNEEEIRNWPHTAALRKRKRYAPFKTGTHIMLPFPAMRGHLLLLSLAPQRNVNRLSPNFPPATCHRGKKGSPIRSLPPWRRRSKYILRRRRLSPHRNRELLASWTRSPYPPTVRSDSVFPPLLEHNFVSVWGVTHSDTKNLHGDYSFDQCVRSLKYKISCDMKSKPSKKYVVVFVWYDSHYIGWRMEMWATEVDWHKTPILPPFLVVCDMLHFLTWWSKHPVLVLCISHFFD